MLPSSLDVASLIRCGGVEVGHQLFSPSLGVVDLVDLKWFTEPINSTIGLQREMALPGSNLLNLCVDGSASRWWFSFFFQNYVCGIDDI